MFGTVAAELEILRSLRVKYYPANAAFDEAVGWVCLRISAVDPAAAGTHLPAMRG